MLQCRNCLQRCIRTIVADISKARAPLKYSHPRPPFLYPRRSATWLRRGYATEALRSHTDHDSSASSIPPAVKPSGTRSKDGIFNGDTFNQKDLERELVWLRDPLKLAARVVALLRHGDDDYDKAFALVRLASKKMECTVSWNHLIDYDMHKARVSAAVKTYNEMKKRAQMPDAHTYTTLFRGFGWHTNFPQTLTRTLSIYHSMFADNAPVRPSIIHTNAVLNVCARCNDMDALFGVTAKLPERGKGAPDTLTFTVILNGIRDNLLKSKARTRARDVLEEEVARSVLQGRRVWEEIRDRWANGDLKLDEELVCALGRLLLESHAEADHDDILSLLEQTMAIPRQIPPLGDPARRGAIRQSKALSSLQQTNDIANAPLDALIPPSHPNTSISDPSSSPFSPLPSLPQRYLVRPSRNTLSLALEACISMSLPRPAQDYWGLLTTPNTPNSTTPDAANYHTYLRLLRLQRASRLTLELVQEICTQPPSTPPIPSPKTFRIAFSTCVRDKRNRAALYHATTLTNLMTRHLETPDPKSLSSYLELCLCPPHRSWRTLHAALDVLEPCLRNLRSFLAYGDGIGGRGSQGEGLWQGGGKKQMEDEVLALANKIVGVYDLVGLEGREVLGEGVRRGLREERWRLREWVRRVNGRRGGGEGEGGVRRLRLGQEGEERSLSFGGEGEKRLRFQEVEGGGKGVEFWG